MGLNRLQRPAAAALAAALAFSALAACSSSGGTGAGEGYADNGTLTYGLPLPLDSVDPFNGSIIQQNYLTYDSLINQTADGEVVSGLAESWELDEIGGGTFTLKDGVTCSDGTPMTPSVVVDNIDFNLDPENGSYQTTINLPTDPFEASADDDAGTLTITFEKPYAYLLETLGRLPIVCPGGLEDRESLAMTSNGTGPYVLEDLAPGDRATYKLRDDYAWGPDGATTDIEGLPETVVLRYVADESTLANLLLSGEVNVGKVTGVDRSRLEGQGLESEKANFSLDPGAWLTFNHLESRATADPAVREALSLALDLDDVVTVSTDGEGERATTMLTQEPAACPDFDITTVMPSQDVERAEQLLDEAGWTMGSDGLREKNGETLKVTLIWNQSAGNFNDKPTSELLAQAWQEIGVEATVEAADQAGWVDRLFTTFDWDVALAGFSFSLPGGTINSWGSEGAFNWAAISNAEFDREVQLAVETPGDEGCEHWYNAEKALLSDFNLFPMAYRYDFWWFKGAEAEISRYDSLAPLSLRVLAS